MSQTPKRKARQAELEVRARSVTLRHPKNRRNFPEVNCNVVHVKEVGSPGAGTDIEWWLLTSLPVESFEEIERVISYYQTRWSVEVYFRVLKTGCRVEKIQLETTARLKKCLAFYQIIAWRVLYLTYQNRESPSMSCAAVLTDEEWQSVWRVTTKEESPAKPDWMSIEQFASLPVSILVRELRYTINEKGFRPRAEKRGENGEKTGPVPILFGTVFE